MKAYNSNNLEHIEEVVKNLIGEDNVFSESYLDNEYSFVAYGNIYSISKGTTVETIEQLFGIGV